MPGFGQVKRRLKWILHYLVWWRVALFVALLVSSLLAFTVSPAALWVIVAWLTLAVLLTTTGARVATTHETVTALQKRINKVETPGTPSTEPTSPDGGSTSLAGHRATLASAAKTLGEAILRIEGGGVGPTAPDVDGPLVSVVVPCYNDERFLADCVQSVLLQTFTRWECIVVDDASTDRSGAIAAELADSDPRVRVITRGRNGGLSAARNTGLLASKGDLVTFLDSDDLLFADSLEHRVGRMVELWAKGDVAGVFCGIRQEGEDYGVADLGESPKWKWGETKDFLSTRGECPFNAHAPLLRRQLLTDIGGFDESMLHGAEDWDLWLRIMRHGYAFEPVSRVGGIYRQRQGSMVKRMPMEHLAEAKRLLRTAHEPFPLEKARVEGPFLFSDPLGVHLEDLDVAGRVLQFAGMTAVADPTAIDEVLTALPDVSLAVVDRHDSTTTRVRSGIRRGLCVGEPEFRRLGDATQDLVERVLSKAASALSVRSSSKGAPPATVVDVCVAAPSAAAIEPLLDMLGDTELEIVYVSLEAEAGDQGATDKLRSLGIEVESFTTYSLSGRQHRALVTAVPYGRAAADLVASTRAAGGTVVELALEDVGHLDENQLHGAGMGPDQAAALLAEINAPPSPACRVTVNEATGPDGLARVEEYPRHAFDGAAIRSMEGAYAGQRCVIVGNGPSLNELDLGLLASTPFFAVNGIFHAGDRLPCPPTFYVVEDNAVAKENTEDIRGFDAEYKFFPSIYRSMFGEAENQFYFRMNRGFYAQQSPHYCVPRFSLDASQRVFCGQSVTIINLQLAHYLGFAEVVLIGMDFSYVIPSDADRSGDLITSRSDDPNHFHPEYFGKGKTWKDPKLPRVLANYQLAKAVFEATGRRIVNATPGGNLHVFERVEFEDAVARRQPEVVTGRDATMPEC